MDASAHADSSDAGPWLRVWCVASGMQYIVRCRGQVAARNESACPAPGDGLPWLPSISRAVSGSSTHSSTSLSSGRGVTCPLCKLLRSTKYRSRLLRLPTNPRALLLTLPRKATPARCTSASIPTRCHLLARRLSPLASLLRSKRSWSSGRSANIPSCAKPALFARHCTTSSVTDRWSLPAGNYTSASSHLARYCSTYTPIKEEHASHRLMKASQQPILLTQMRPIVLRN